MQSHLILDWKREKIKVSSFFCESDVMLLQSDFFLLLNIVHVKQTNKQKFNRIKKKYKKKIHLEYTDACMVKLQTRKQNVTCKLVFEVYIDMPLYMSVHMNFFVMGSWLGSSSWQ